MAQDITLMGASYSAVPAVQLPKTGGGTASFTDVTDTTAVAGDVASGKYFYTAAGVLTQGTASGGGGASNVVMGTFKGTTTGAGLEITLDYSGNGYPIAVMIYPANTDITTFNSTIKRYAIRNYTMDKNVRGTPSYSASQWQDYGNVSCMYKNSTSNSNTYAHGGSTSRDAVYDANSSTSATPASVVKIKSNKKMEVMIASSSYGFMANIEYAYVVIYSE